MNNKNEVIEITTSKHREITELIRLRKNPLSIETISTKFYDYFDFDDNFFYAEVKLNEPLLENKNYLLYEHFNLTNFEGINTDRSYKTNTINRLNTVSILIQAEA